MFKWMSMMRCFICCPLECKGLLYCSTSYIICLYLADLVTRNFKKTVQISLKTRWFVERWYFVQWIPQSASLLVCVWRRTYRYCEGLLTVYNVRPDTHTIQTHTTLFFVTLCWFLLCIEVLWQFYFWYDTKNMCTRCIDRSGIVGLIFISLLYNILNYM